MISYLLLALVVLSLYNFIRFQNYFFIFTISVGLSIIYYVKNPRNFNFITQNEKEKNHVNAIIETFDLREFATNMYDIHKIPKQFKYIFIKPEILKNLIQLQFVKKFDNEVYTKIYIILEKFLRMFYNGITDRNNKKHIIESMKQLHEEMKTYANQLKINVPMISKHIKRFGKKNLHTVIDDNMKHIDNFMTNKIVIIKALIDKKIK